jgi:hypothetical protein
VGRSGRRQVRYVARRGGAGLADARAPAALLLASRAARHLAAEALARAGLDEGPPEIGDECKPRAQVRLGDTRRCL